MTDNTDSLPVRKAELRDPSAKYPKPPFKRQSQPWPGLARKMDPPPDHGETSYKGPAGSPGARR